MSGFLDSIKSVFGKKEETVEMEEVPNSFEIPNNEQEPEVEIIRTANSWDNYRYSMDFDSKSNNVSQLVKEYRDIAQYPEIDEAISEIVNESIVFDDDDVVTLSINTDEINEKLKEGIIEEFKNVSSMLDFNNKGDEIFRQWYVDGRLYLHGVLDLKKPKEGIQDIKVLAPFNLKQIKEDGKLFFIHDDGKSEKALKIPSEHITFVHSSLSDPKRDYYISHLHKAIKPYNQLKMLEDAAVIYRITRAPERRVFYVDVGKMNKSKAESYMASLISKFKNEVTYDQVSGKISQSKNTLSMTEDFWLPSSESSNGSRGTKIDVLPAGQQLGEMGDIQYFNKKLKKSLNVPFSRFDSEERSTLAFGQNIQELGRDEVRFSKFIGKLRNNFGQLFFDLLKKQLIFKGILTIDDWYKFKDGFKLKWNTDSYFTEIKESEMLKGRLELADSMTDYVGKYFSHEYVMKKVFQMSDEEVKEEMDKIAEEKKNKTFEVDDNQEY